MILFHYSVDSYTDSPSLTNDFAGHYKYAEPFLLALERGRQVFDAVFALARKYFALERTESPLIEILADGENRVRIVETY